jgi:hypothetical protein
MESNLKLVLEELQKLRLEMKEGFAVFTTRLDDVATADQQREFPRRVLVAQGCTAREIEPVDIEAVARATATSDVAHDELGLTTNSFPARGIATSNALARDLEVTAPLYRVEGSDHIERIHGIEHGDALRGLRPQDEIANIAKEVGFAVVKELELGLAPPSALPWSPTRLKMVHVQEFEKLQVTDAPAKCSTKCLSGINGLLL